MGELYGTCALLAAVLFFVLLQKFESRFGKVDKELGEIKKRMDDLLKAQEKMASGPVRAKEDVTAETLDNTDILPYVTEELPDSTVTALKEEKAVEEKAVEGIQPIMAETTPQKLNASLEKNLLRPLCRKLLQRLLSKYRLFPNGSRLTMKSLSVKIFSVRLVFLYSSSESASL